jgi:hypothetical protein
MSDLLCLTFDPKCYDCEGVNSANNGDDDENGNPGNVRFYRRNSNGGYIRDNGGEYVKILFPQGNDLLKETYLHYTQLYKPIAFIREMLGTVLIVMAVSYEYYQSMLAEMNSYVSELEELNTRLNEINRNFAKLSGYSTNYNNTGDNGETMVFKPEFWEPLVEAGIVDLYHETITDVIPPLLAVNFMTTDLTTWDDLDKIGTGKWCVLLFNLEVDAAGKLRTKAAADGTAFWMDENGADRFQQRTHANNYWRTNITTLSQKISFLSHRGALEFQGKCPPGGTKEILVNAGIELGEMITGFLMTGKVKYEVTTSYRTAMRGAPNNYYHEDDDRYNSLYFELYDTMYHYDPDPTSATRPFSKIVQGEGVKHFHDELLLNQSIDTRKYTTKQSVKSILESAKDSNSATDSFVSNGEINIFIDKLRYSSDTTNNSIQSASNLMLSTVQNFSQVFAASTELISTVGSLFLRTARNVR